MKLTNCKLQIWGKKTYYFNREIEEEEGSGQWQSAGRRRAGRARRRSSSHAMAGAWLRAREAAAGTGASSGGVQGMRAAAVAGRRARRGGAGQRARWAGADQWGEHRRRGGWPCLPASVRCPRGRRCPSYRPCEGDPGRQLHKGEHRSRPGNGHLLGWASD